MPTIELTGTDDVTIRLKRVEAYAMRALMYRGATGFIRDDQGAPLDVSHNSVLQMASDVLAEFSRGLDELKL